MTVNNENIHDLIHDSAGHATELLTHMSSLTEDPVTAVISLMLATAVVARSMDLPLDVLLGGIKAASTSIQEATHHAAH